MINVLVLCTGNSCRSQIAHGFLAHFTNPKLVTIYSAGIETHGVNPMAIATMQAVGIDISAHTSNHVDEYINLKFDYVITVCDHAKENCPYIAHAAVRLHHQFTDPSKATGSPDEIAQAFATARQEIMAYCQAFVSDYLM